MMIDTDRIISITNANQNFSKAAKMAEQYGSVMVFKNNKPKYVLIDMEKRPYIELTDDERIDIVSGRLMERFRSAYKELAK